MTFPIRRVIIDADLLVLSLETLEYSDALERFLRNEGSMFFFIVQDCLERACERHNKDPQEVFSLLSGNVGINIRTSDDVNRDVLGNAINDLESIRINEEDAEKYWDSKVELAYAQAHQIQELLTHRPNDFSVYDSVGHGIQIQVIQPRKWPLRLPRLFRQWWSDLGFRRYLVLVILGFLIAVGCYLIVIQPSPSVCTSRSYDFLTCGGNDLVENHKQQGMNLFREKKYGEALREFKLHWQETQDPETLIYLNNAFLELERKQRRRDFNTIAVLVPLSKQRHTDINDERDLAKEILRGVAQAQTKYHADIFDEDVFSENGIFGSLAETRITQSDKKGIRVMIVDDRNDSDGVDNLTKELVKMDEIIAFVGHYASDLTMKAVRTYNDNKKVLISSGTTTEELSENRYEYFFRTVPSAKYHAQLLFDYIDKEINPENKNTKNVAVCYVDSSPFSRSIHDEFQKLLDEKKASEMKEIKYEKCIGTQRNNTFSGLQFQAEEALKEMDEADILVLFPDGQTSNSMKNALDLIKENEGDKYIFGSWNLRNNRTLEKLKTLEDTEKALEDEKLVLVVPWEYPSPTNDYAEDVEKLWNGHVGPITALSYDTTEVLISTMDNNPPSLQESLKEQSYQGVTGEISFDRCGNRKSNPMFLVKVVEEGNYSLKFEKISNYSKTFSEPPEECQDENN